MKRMYLLLTLTLAGAFLIGCNPNGNVYLGSSASDEEARYTVFLTALQGRNHIREARRYKQQTERHAGWKDLYIVHKSDRSDLFWGKYRTLDEARKRVGIAKAWVAPAGVRLYQKALVLPIPGEDFGPPEYKLANANGYWTVLVAIFEDVPEEDYYSRKKDAVEYCKYLRKQGEQAYYHHEVAKSKVTIGSFPESAMRMMQKGRTHVPTIMNPKMQQIIQRHPKLAVNGHEEIVRRSDPRTGGLVEVVSRSHPIKIPEKTGSLTESGGVGQRQFPGVNPR
ncbi:MAG: hypothetical protein ACLFVU_02245 [Phycisphaerae bacterium]